MINQEMTRRTVLGLAAGGAAMIAAGPAFGSLSLPPKTDQNIALQLYSVRSHCKKDFDATLEAVAKMGYEAVEFAGYYKYASDPEGLRKRLDDLGLKVAGTHTRTNTLVGDSLKKTIDFHRKIGCKLLIVPADKAVCHPEDSKAFAETLVQAAEALKPEGMACGFHNHAREFGKHEGKTWWDLLAERTNDDVVLQLDVGWSTHAGVDSAALIRKYPGRTVTAHFKPHLGKDADGQPVIGQDSVKWKEIITACREVGGTEWFTVEQEKYIKGKTPLECSELSLKGLKEILEGMK